MFLAVSGSRQEEFLWLPHMEKMSSITEAVSQKRKAMEGIFEKPTTFILNKGNYNSAEICQLLWSQQHYVHPSCQN